MNKEIDNLQAQRLKIGSRTNVRAREEKRLQSNSSKVNLNRHFSQPENLNEQNFIASEDGEVVIQEHIEPNLKSGAATSTGLAELEPVHNYNAV